MIYLINISTSEREPFTISDGEGYHNVNADHVLGPVGCDVARRWTYRAVISALIAAVVTGFPLLPVDLLWPHITEFGGQLLGPYMARCGLV